jgi:sulfur carrier protein
MTVITLNGERRELGGTATIETAVRALVTDDARGVAVALDGEVIPRGEWASTAVRDGQQVEVLHAVQGGA